MKLDVWSGGSSVEIHYDIGDGLDVLKLQISSMFACLATGGAGDAHEEEGDQAEAGVDVGFALLDYLGREIESEADLLYLHSLSFRPSPENTSRYVVVCSTTHCATEAPAAAAAAAASAPVSLWVAYNGSGRRRYAPALCTAAVEPGELLQPGYQVRDTTFRLCHVCIPDLDEALLSVSAAADVGAGSCLHRCSRDALLEFGLIVPRDASNGASSACGGGAAAPLPYSLCFKRRLYELLVAQQQQQLPLLEGAAEGAQRQQQFQRRLASTAQSVAVYEQPDQQAAALSVVNYAQVSANMAARLAADPAEPHDVAFIKSLLLWFKRDLFRWVLVECTHCKAEAEAAGRPYARRVESVGVTDQVLPEERGGWPGRVELSRCGDCQRIIRFPRNNNPAFLLTRAPTGRCGEFANAWGLLCRALSLDIIYALDFTDHVWIEVFVPSYNRYVHTDPCENAFDRPLLYEKGWGKKLTYVVGLNRAGCCDLTPKYTRRFEQCVVRRQQQHVPEAVARRALALLDGQLESQLRTRLQGLDSIRIAVPHPTLSAVLPIYSGLLSVGAPGFQALALYSPNSDLGSAEASARGILMHKRRLRYELSGVLLLSEESEARLQDQLFPLPTAPPSAVAADAEVGLSRRAPVNGHTALTAKNYVFCIPFGACDAVTSCAVGEVGGGGSECAANLLWPDASKWCLCALSAEILEKEQVWLQCELPGPRTLAHYVIASANDCPGRNPTAWRVLGRRSGVETTGAAAEAKASEGEDRWEVLHEVSVSQDPFEGRFHHCLHFSISEGSRGRAFDAVRLFILRNGGDGEIQLSHWLFYDINETEGEESDGVSSLPAPAPAVTEAYGGRVSGDDAWKRARGESGLPLPPSAAAVTPAPAPVPPSNCAAVAAGCASAFREAHQPASGHINTPAAAGVSPLQSAASDVPHETLVQVDQLIETVSRHRVGGDGGAALKLLHTFLSNVATNPTEVKYRSINAESNAFKSKLLPLVGPVQLLKLVGFAKSTSEEKYILENANVRLLQIVCTKLQAAISSYEELPQPV